MNTIPGRGPFRLAGLAGLVFACVALASADRLAAQEEGAGDRRAEQRPRAAGQSSEAALGIYADAANFQNAGAFDLAIEEWKKFLDAHPDDPLAPKAAHYLGVSLMQQESPDYAAAASAFGRALGDDDFDLREEALVNRGWCLYAAGQAAEGEGRPESHYREALETFETLTDEFPRSKYLDQAYFYSGESAYALGQRDEAVAFYERLLEQPAAEESSLRCDALYARGVALEESERVEPALQAYARLLEACPETPLEAEVRVRRGDLLVAQSQWTGAAEEFGRALAAGGELADYALYRQAYCLNRAGRSSDAAAAYDRLIREFPQSRYAGAAQLAAAQSYYQAGEMDEATAGFRELLERDDAATRIEAAHWLSQIALRRGDAEEAIRLARAALEVPGDAPYRAALKMDLAEALSLTPDGLAEAASLYEEIYRDAPDDPLAPRALYNAAFAALQAGRAQDAVDLAGRFLERYPRDDLAGDVRYVAAEARLQAGNHSAAAAIYDELLAEAEDHPSRNLWVLRAATARYLNGDYREAIERVQPALESMQQPSERAEALFLIGASQLYSGQPSEAAESLSESLETDAGWSEADEAMLLLGQAQVASERRDAALDTWAGLIERFDSPMVDQARYRIAKQHSADGHFEQALEQYQAMLDAGKDASLRPYALYGKGWCLMQRQRYEEAVGPLEQVLDEYDGHALEAEAQLARGICRRRLGDNRSAVADLERYLGMNPTGTGLGHALYELALVDLERDRNAEAAERLRRLVDEVPDYPYLDKVLYELAWALKEEGRAEDAANQFEQLVSRFPDTPLAAEASYQVGQQHYASRRWDRAAEAFRTAAARADGEELIEKSLYKLGWSLFQQQDYEQAKATFADQLQRFPDGELAIDAQLLLAESDFKAERFEQALAAFAEARERMQSAGPLPADASRQAQQVRQLVLLHGGQAAAQLKRWDEALAWFDQLREDFPNTRYLPQVFYESGYCHQQLGENERALKLYGEVASNYRNELAARARFMMGELYFSERDLAKAIPEFQRVMYGFGGEEAPPEIRTWQAKSGFEAGRCAELLIQSASGEKRERATEIARGFYEYVIEKHGDSDLVGKARERLDVLRRL